MNLKEKETTVIHKVKSSWGVGTFRRCEGSFLIFDFEEAGEKKFTEDALGSMLILANNTEEGENDMCEKAEAKLVQFDGECATVGGKNIIPAFTGNDNVIFNESYTVAGIKLQAHKIHAMYDLVVLGDVCVDECVVNGSLTVLGHLKASVLTCSNACVVKGNITADKIYVGGELVAASVKCNEIVCEENALIRTTIDIDSAATIGKTIVAYEGVIGAGRFVAQNAIANEYFEFDGDVQGHVLELETDTTISELVRQEDQPQTDLSTSINEAVTSTVSACPEYEEEEVLAALHKLTLMLNGNISAFGEYEALFRKLIEISYAEKISTFSDYIAVLLAKAVLPSELYKYETVEFVDQILCETEEILDTIQYEPTEVSEFADTIKAICLSSHTLNIDATNLFDKAFEAIGLRYDTVRRILDKNRANVTSNVISEEKNEQEKIAEPIKPIQVITKTEFMGKKVSHLAKQFGITDSELERLASVKVKTCSDFLKLSGSKIVSIFGKKAFLANHLLQVQKKVQEKVDSLD